MRKTIWKITVCLYCEFISHAPLEYLIHLIPRHCNIMPSFFYSVTTNFHSDLRHEASRIISTHDKISRHKKLYEARPQFYLSRTMYFSYTSRFDSYFHRLKQILFRSANAEISSTTSSISHSAIRIKKNGESAEDKDRERARTNAW